jgi:hypothetical protein
MQRATPLFVADQIQAFGFAFTPYCKGEVSLSDEEDERDQEKKR